MIPKDNILGILLAGGQARRMGGGDKCLLPLGDKTLLQRSIAKAQPQVGQLLLSANGNNLRFARSRLPVVADLYPDFPGPLAGIHAGMEWVREHSPETEWLASFACDTPFFPDNLVEQLAARVNECPASIVVPTSDDQMHPIFGLWHLSLYHDLCQTLEGDEIPRLQDWITGRSHTLLDVPSSGYDPFFNINSPQDLYDAEAFLPLTQ